MSTADHASPGRPAGSAVSVVIPAYRSAATIARAIDSALAQTEPANEIIVVDDGSPDDQAKVVEDRYGAEVTLIRQENGGAAAARNAGINRARGDYIAFLDADDYWEESKLALQLRLFQRHAHLGLVAGAFFEQAPGQPRHSKPVIAAPASWYDRVLTLAGIRAFRLATTIFTSTVLVRREALGSERFPVGLATAEDRDLWARLVSRHPVLLTSEPVATAVLTEGSLSRSSVETDCASMLRVIDRNRSLLGPWGTALWRSHTLYRWAALDPSPASALPRLLRSLALWPLPYTGFASCDRFCRVKKLAVLVAAAVRGQGLSSRRGTGQ